MEVFKNVISVLSLLVAIPGSILAVKKLIENKRDKEQKARRNGDMQEEKNYSEESTDVGKSKESVDGLESNIGGLTLKLILPIIPAVVAQFVIDISITWIKVCILVCTALAGYALSFACVNKTEKRKKIGGLICALIFFVSIIILLILGYDKHVHTWSASVVREATCINDGEREKKCDCEETEIEIIEKLGHTWKAATCTEAETCQRCGETEGSALGHDWKAATCTEAKTCQRCKEIEGTALGHNWIGEVTCTEAKTCPLCGEVEGSALGHDWNEVSCTEAKECKRCGVVEKPALGHKWIEATCMEAKTCQQCGEVEGTASGHNWANATCTEAKTCRQCGEVTGTALGHDWNDATCTEAKTCRQCGEVTGTALGHDWNEATCITSRKCELCGVTEGVALGHKYDSDTDLNCNVCNYVRGYWSEYGAWSAWQDEVVTASEKRQIEENPKVIAGYNKKTQWKYNRYWGYYEEGGYYLAWKSSSGICTNYEETEWLDYPLEYKSHTSKSGEVSWGYGMNDYGTKKYIHWYNEQTQKVDDLNSPIYKTQYRYRDRYIIYY